MLLFVYAGVPDQVQAPFQLYGILSPKVEISAVWTVATIQKHPTMLTGRLQPSITNRRSHPEGCLVRDPAQVDTTLSIPSHEEGGPAGSQAAPVEASTTRSS